MPTPERLEQFIARVEENAHDHAIEEFYTENASMQENQSAPRLGREAHVPTNAAFLPGRNPLPRSVFGPSLSMVTMWSFAGSFALTGRTAPGRR